MTSGKPPKFGPGRGELQLRLAISLAGLALMAYALSRHGAGGMASSELMVFGGLFFGGSAVWSAWQLWRGRGR